MGYQVYGRMYGEFLVVTADHENGVPVEFSEVPKDVPDGYEAVSKFVDAGTSVKQTWSVQPSVGTKADASIRLAEIQAESLSDERALEVQALYPEWNPGNAAYKAGERLQYKGVLYKVIKDNKPQVDWTPDTASSLFARVLPGQSGEVGEWVQPDSTNGYSKGDRVTHNGKTWESSVDKNVWEPGANGVTQWVEVADAQ